MTVPGHHSRWAYAALIIGAAAVALAQITDSSVHPSQNLHTIFLLPLAVALAGAAAAVTGIIKAPRWDKLVAVFGLLINFVAIVWMLLVYAFSFWLF